MSPTTHVQAAAERLWTARRTLTSLPSLREFLEPDAVEDAYAVQALNNARKLATGARRIGRKIGLTSRAVQVQLGVGQPDFGLLFEDMYYKGPMARVPAATLLQPRIEGEIAFIVGEDILQSGLSREELRRRSGMAVPAFEIVASAIADWKISIADTIADNASCGALVVGTDPRPIAALDLRLCGMVLSSGDEVLSVGVGAASLGDPLNAFAWLADLAVRQGDPIRAGEVVLTGALGPMVPFTAGRAYRLEVAGFAPLEVVAE